MIVTYRMRLSNCFHMCTGMQKIEKNSLCNWVFYELPFSIWILMIRIQISNLWIESVSILRPSNVFWNTLSPIFTKKSSSKIERTFLQFHFTSPIIWKLHIQMARCEVMILWNNTTFLPHKNVLIDLWSFYRVTLVPLTRPFLILTAFQPHLLNSIHVCQKSLTTHWMMKLWKNVTLLLRNTVHIAKFSLWLLNQLLLFSKRNIDILHLQIFNLFLMLKLPLLQSLWQ